MIYNRFFRTIVYRAMMIMPGKSDLALMTAKYSKRLDA